MARLNGQKQLLLNQVKNQPNLDVRTLVDLIAKYEDLGVSDFKGYVSDLLFEQLQEAGRDPHEAELWNRIQGAPRTTSGQIQGVQRMVSTYVQQYPDGPKAGEAQTLMSRLQAELNDMRRKEDEAARRAKEQRDWDMLEKGNYNALRNYKQKYPDSVHMAELDEFMWTNTKTALAEHTLRRYLADWPAGIHAAEATEALSGIAEWEAVKRSHDLFKVDDYRDNHPDCLFKPEVDSLYYQLRDEMLKKMKEAPSEFGRKEIERLISADIFTRWELIDEELVTDESWEILFETDRDLFPDIQAYQVEDPNIAAPEGCTDIFLFGTPGTGKTCLLMGLAGANGKEYTLNMKSHGGSYAAALQQYVNAGITPGRTFGKFVTVINGQVHETDKRNNLISHRINLVEMSGEEFALKIADGKGVALADMGTGATNLLRNKNKKVFFIIVDSSKSKVKFEYLAQIRDASGNVVDEHIRKKYISQLDILNKFVSLFELPENQDIMKQVDAIHFVVTKADILGDSDVRLQKARDLLLSVYEGPVMQLKNYCRTTKRINYSTNYNPQVFAFSLGKFYLGDVFRFDKSETLKIIDTIRIVTNGLKEKTWWDKFKESIN